MATNYSRGASFERRVVDDMTKHGYVAVRAAGSRTPADVYAFRYGSIVLIQCKRDGRLDPDEWNGFWEYATLAGATPILAMTGPGNRGIIYKRLTSRKDGRGRQPLTQWGP